MFTNNEDNPFYENNDKLNSDLIIKNKIESLNINKKNKDTCCGQPFDKIEIDGGVKKLCRKCGNEIKTYEVASHVTQSRRGINTGQSIVNTSTNGTTIVRRTCYPINDPRNYYRKVDAKNISDILRRSKLTGIKIDSYILVKALDYFDQIRKNKISRSGPRNGLLAECIIQAYKYYKQSYDTTAIIKLMGIESKYLSDGTKLFTRYLKPFNIDDWMEKCKRDIKYILRQLNAYTKKRYLFCCNIVKYTAATHIAIHSGDKARCVGAIWLMAELDEKINLNIKTDIKKLYITAKTVMDFVDCVKVKMWQMPLPNNDKFPDRERRTRLRRDQLREIVEMYGYKVPIITNTGRFKKYFKNNLI